MSPNDDLRKGGNEKELGEQATDVVPGMVSTPPDAAKIASFPPDLSRVAASWNYLPDAIKFAILAIVCTHEPQAKEGAKQ